MQVNTNFLIYLFIKQFENILKHYFNCFPLRLPVQIYKKGQSRRTSLATLDPPVFSISTAHAVLELVALI